ncbi:hypothetical protein BSTEL_0599 [Bifidobacterium stellenboschense]|uniref:Uncharacterized protein n=1 Tax=Bifidobacterium stellenboschense TaxID=762211 RepID=A0A087DQI8_9BIFI|nr:hypothetical protein BSTEL_0599 [Bifidobacterium stellenboschense]
MIADPLPSCAIRSPAAHHRPRIDGRASTAAAHRRTLIDGHLFYPLTTGSLQQELLYRSTSPDSPPAHSSLGTSFTHSPLTPCNRGCSTAPHLQTPLPAHSPLGHLFRPLTTERPFRPLATGRLFHPLTTGQPFPSASLPASGVVCVPPTGRERRREASQRRSCATRGAETALRKPTPSFPCQGWRATDAHFLPSVVSLPPMARNRRRAVFKQRSRAILGTEPTEGKVSPTDITLHAGDDATRPRRYRMPTAMLTPAAHRQHTSSGTPAAAHQQ